MADTIQPPPPAPAAPGLTPSNATLGSSLGALIAFIVISIFHAYHVDFPAGVEGAIASVITIIAGYIPRSGRQ
jgi:hypothetical protein